MTRALESAYLIVNADDFGYSHGVTRGILKAAAEGVVTATGVFATSAHFDEHVTWLRDCDALDAGVHLNLTLGAPLSGRMRDKLARWSGRFPGKFSAAFCVLRGVLTPEDVRLEWRAQIERCLAGGIRLRFLNSHEHVHMLPPLFRMTNELAVQYAIAHVRFPSAGLAGTGSANALLRGAIIKTLETINRRHLAFPTVRFLGLAPSGKLTLSYFEEILPTLQAGEVYELMCHPGELDRREVHDARLLRYHDWDGELRTLTDQALRQLLRRHGIQLIGYRHLERGGERLVVRH